MKKTLRVSMRDTVLILTNTEDDLHVEPVIKKINHANKKVFRFNSDTLLNGKSRFFIYSTKYGIKFSLFNGDEVISSDSVKSVWYRKPHFFNLSVKDFAQRQQAEAEINSCFNGICLVLNKCFWISRPFSIERAKEKIYQLDLASRIGFIIPRTIITNDPDEFRLFYSDCGGLVIYKSLKQSYFDYFDKNRVVSTTKITDEHLVKIGMIQSTPSLFQELIQKLYEIRVTIVGDKVFAIKIDSQAYEATSLDWREPAYIEKLNYKIIQLPHKIESQCKRIVKDLGLNFGAIDLIVDKQGNYIFLEINPNGQWQWQWLEYFVDVDISGAIAKKLIRSFE